MHARVAFFLAATSLVVAACGDHDVAPDAASPAGERQPHGCSPSGNDCPGTESCTFAHQCCAGIGSDCGFRIFTADSGVMPSLAPCASDEACGATEYCERPLASCCLIGYSCDVSARPAQDAADAFRDAAAADRLPDEGGATSDSDVASADAAAERTDGRPVVTCGPQEYCNPSGNCCGVGAVCSVEPSDASSCFPPL